MLLRVDKRRDIQHDTTSSANRVRVALLLGVMNKKIIADMT